jgi:hypothetical protein
MVVMSKLTICMVAFLAVLTPSTGFVPHDALQERPIIRTTRMHKMAAAAGETADCCPPAGGGSDGKTNGDQKKVRPDILQPFLPAMDPNYRNVGPVGQQDKGDFVVSRTGGPTAAELTNENILKIVSIQCSDLEVNTLVWKCLGYRFNEANGRWSADECFPNWKERFPDPPDLIGMQRIYSPEVDKPSLKANQALVRSIPADNKQSLKTYLKPLGWKGYQYAELTPNKTRRAQCANWLIFYREELFGYTVEELRERRKRKADGAEAKATEPREGEWKPPVKEVF